MSPTRADTSRKAALALLLGGALGGWSCTDEVPLGSFGRPENAGTAGSSGAASGPGGSSGSGGSSGTAGTSGSSGSSGSSGTGGQPSGGTGGEAGAEPLSCLPTDPPGPTNPAGTDIAMTNTYTDWFWPGPMDMLEWQVEVERDNLTDGYMWAHQFGFVASGGGFTGIQVNGGYSADPPDGPYEITNMIVFWIAGPPIRAELGEIAYPDARIAPNTARGLDWLTIHARYTLAPCHTYRLRAGRESVDVTGDIWIGAWILDTTTGIELMYGRMLVPKDWGQLSSLSTEWTTRVGYRELTTCADAEPASGFLATPTANGGVVLPTDHNNRFDSPPHCPTSRFTNLPGGVRHEVGL